MVAPVRLSIGALQVAGMGRRDATRLGAALEARLGVLLQERGVPPHWPGGIGPVRVTPRDRRDPERLGAAIAEALWARPNA
jgi:hypothetical protein